ncbi:MAG: hypothetical protein NZ553_00560 [Caldilinea sp.]|nr:hypothetical protein [Caldilinea sp.]MDW8438938.1 hypothetical protein [Caldilineaceae bacterium]
MVDLRLRTWLWALLLISSGVALLLFEFGLLTPYTPQLQYFLAVLAAFGATLFFGGFAKNPSEWWRVLPGWTLLALALLLLLSAGEMERHWLGAIVFAGLALGFIHIYLNHRSERWWALLTAGFLLVFGLVIGFSAWFHRVEWMALVLFGGSGTVFFLLFLLHRRQWWAVLPGGVLWIFAALLAVRNEDGGMAPLLRWWPVILIVAGLLIALRPRGASQRERLEVHHAPTRRRRNDASTTQSASSTPILDYTKTASGSAIEVLPDTDD